jgi:hypothetical protein
MDDRIDPSAAAAKASAARADEEVEKGGVKKMIERVDGGRIWRSGGERREGIFDLLKDL